MERQEWERNKNKKTKLPTFCLIFSFIPFFVAQKTKIFFALPLLSLNEELIRVRKRERANLWLTLCSSSTNVNTCDHTSL